MALTTNSNPAPRFVLSFQVEGRTLRLFCSRTLAVYRITRCEEVILYLKPLAFNLDPPVLTASKVFLGIECWLFSSAFVLANLWFCFGRDIKLWKFLSHENLSLDFKNFKLVSQRKVQPFLFIVNLQYISINTTI